MNDATLPIPKRPAEKFRIGWDWKNDLATGDGAASQTVTAKQVDTGADVTATFTESPSLASNISTVRVKAGDDGKDYDVTFVMTSTNGDIFQRTIRVRVKA